MIHQVEAVKYDSRPNRAFQDALRKRLGAYLRTQPYGRKATPFMAFKVVFFLVSYWMVWASLALFEHGVATTFGLLTLFSALCVAVAYNVAHDAVHDALSSRKWVNELLFQVSFNCLGPSAYLWRFRHKIMHHNCVNIPGLDFNIEASDLLRFAPTQRWLPIHRFQHLYAPFAYLIFTTHWVFVKDVRMLFLDRIGNLTNIRHPWPRIAEVLLWKAIYVTYMFAVPLWATEHTFWQVLVGYVYFQFVVSFQFVITFTGSHLNQGMLFVEKRDGRIPHSFWEHQLQTSMDFHPTNPLLSFWLGGFNSHVAHHLFPQVCSVHYPALSRIIQETAREHGMPYRETSIGKLFWRHFVYLYEMGRDPVSPRAAYLMYAR